MGSINSKIEHPDMDQSKDGLRAMQGWMESKLKTFYLEVEQELTQGGKGMAVDIPIVSIIDKQSDTFVKDNQHNENSISTSVLGAIDKIISGDWKLAITDVLKGGANVFLGPTRAGSQGTMQEHKSFHLVWSDTALLRLDMYMLRFNVSTNSDFKGKAEFFAGHMLIKSIVDIYKVSSQIISYEIVKFLAVAGKCKDKDGKLVYESPKNKLLEQIGDCKEIFGGVATLLEMISEHQNKKHSSTESPTGDALDSGNTK